MTEQHKELLIATIKNLRDQVAPYMKNRVDEDWQEFIATTELLYTQAISQTKPIPTYPEYGLEWYLERLPIGADITKNHASYLYYAVHWRQFDTHGRTPKEALSNMYELCVAEGVIQDER